MGPPDRQNRTPRELPQRTPSVSERIANRLKEIQRKSAASSAAKTEEQGVVQFDADKDGSEKDGADEKSEKDTAPLLDKGKGRAVDSPESARKKQDTLPASPPPLDPPLPPQKLMIPGSAPVRGSSPMPPPPATPIVLAGVSLPPPAVSSLLARAAEQLPLRPIRFALLGEYQDCFSGEEFVTWLRENVEAFENSWDRADDAAREITEKQGLLRRIGELGNQFESSDDAYYQFRPKVPHRIIPTFL